MTAATEISGLPIDQSVSGRWIFDRIEDWAKREPRRRSRLPAHGDGGKRHGRSTGDPRSDAGIPSTQLDRACSLCRGPDFGRSHDGARRPCRRDRLQVAGRRASLRT